MGARGVCYRHFFFSRVFVRSFCSFGCVAVRAVRILAASRVRKKCDHKRAVCSLTQQQRPLFFHWTACFCRGRLPPHEARVKRRLLPHSCANPPGSDPCPHFSTNYTSCRGNWHPTGEPTTRSPSSPIHNYNHSNTNMPSLLSLPSIALCEATTTTASSSSSHFANNIAIDCDEGIEAWLVSPPPSAHTSKATTSAKNNIVASDSSSTMKFFRLRRRTPNSNTSTTTITTKPQYKVSNHSHKGPTHNGSEDASQSSSACSPTLSRSPPALIHHHHHHPASFTTANRKSSSSRISSAVAALWLEMGQPAAHHHEHPCPSSSSSNKDHRHHHPFPDKSRTRGTHTGPRGAPLNQRSGTTSTSRYTEKLRRFYTILYTLTVYDRI